MKPDQIVQELEGVARHFGVQVRVEKGRFRGGRCTVEGEAFVVLNKLHPPEVRVAILAESLRDLPLDTVFIRPAVRRALEEAWSASAPDANADPAA